jgi:hypothetical protein
MFGLIKDRFSSINKIVAKHLEENILATMKCANSDTYEIIRTLCKDNNKSFKTNEMSFYRFLQDSKMQIDDTWWRKHIGLIFDLLEERKLISIKEKIQINVDFSSCEDYFLIMSASIIIYDKAITLYFTTRVYPKRKGDISQTKMEQAFIKGLRHILSKKYQYVIVADRGFGSNRFMNLCVNNNFDFVIRSNKNLNIIVDGSEKDKNKNIENLQDITTETKFSAFIPTWKEKRYITIKKSETSIWYLISNNKDLNAFDYYSNRFKIEKIYQDFKSSGYKLEQNKIRKYDRFRRLLYLVSLAHCLTCIIGGIVKNTTNNIKKNSTEQGILSLNLILAFSRLDLNLSPSIFKNPLSYLKEEYILIEDAEKNVGE